MREKTEEEKRKRNERVRKWQKEHPVQFYEQQVRYWTRKLEEAKRREA